MHILQNTQELKEEFSPKKKRVKEEQYHAHLCKNMTRDVLDASPLSLSDQYILKHEHALIFFFMDGLTLFSQKKNRINTQKPKTSNGKTCHSLHILD